MIIEAMNYSRPVTDAMRHDWAINTAEHTGIAYSLYGGNVLGGRMTRNASALPKTSSSEAAPGTRAERIEFWLNEVKKEVANGDAFNAKANTLALLRACGECAANVSITEQVFGGPGAGKRKTHHFEASMPRHRHNTPCVECGKTARHANHHTWKTA